MHEMSLAEGVLQLVEETAQREGAGRVLRVVLEIGQLSSVEPEALKFCFDAVIRDSIAAEAVLECIEVPGAGGCLECGRTVALATVYGPCPECGSCRVRASSGTEMRVREIEIE
jgi:hydrogenase nickel incorporation protein HypA/HybF